MIIPCYNEALTIGKVVEDFRRELPEASVYVYDNNSTDGTAEIANGSGAIVRNEPRQKKTACSRPRFGGAAHLFELNEDRTQPIVLTRLWDRKTVHK